MKDRDRWNERYKQGYGSTAPNPRLAEYKHLLSTGLALDLAGGVGKNAQLLEGWTTIVADISDRALEQAGGIRVQIEAPWLPFRDASFDTVLCTYFFDPRVDFYSLLKPGGTLFFETYTVADAKYRPDFPASYRLDPENLQGLFSGLTRLVWEETDDGSRVIGTLVARKG